MDQIAFLLKAGMAAQERWHAASWSTRIHFVDRRTSEFVIPVMQPPTIEYDCPSEWGPPIEDERVTMYRYTAGDNQFIYIGYGPKSDVLVIFYG